MGMRLVTYKCHSQALSSSMGMRLVTSPPTLRIGHTGSDGVWIELTYSGGSKYHSHCGSVARTARIVFLCDPNVGGMVCDPNVVGTVCDLPGILYQHFSTNTFDR